MDTVKIVDGEIFTDHRGTIRSLNNFLFENIKRTYIIHHPEPSIIRGWHGHMHERKWFYCLKGAWTLALVKIDDWTNPSPDLVPQVFQLNENESKLICVPAGYANCLKAHSPESIIQVFSDVPIPEAYNDSWRYNSELWMNWSNF